MKLKIETLAFISLMIIVRFDEVIMKPAINDND